jgi:hypothetical protein
MVEPARAQLSSALSELPQQDYRHIDSPKAQLRRAPIVVLGLQPKPRGARAYLDV